ncbi:hypothetical protein [Phaffia rhodozyma]|uniref:Uncharacterized protein n=1 Tax=Phaffia rhodozyma TaxID=264483 RepID=A0A0F7SIX6_PHARH|nr:hypothetical protein [Phaffia rhodozyma]
MRLLLGKKSNRSLKQATSSSPPPPPSPLTYPLPVLPPLVHVQTASCPTSPGKPTPPLGKSSVTTPLRIHAMFSRSFSMNDVSLTGHPGQPALVSGTNPPYSVDSSDRLDENFSTMNPLFIRRSASDPVSPASPPYASSSLASLPSGAAPAWKAARDAIASRGQSDERQMDSALPPPPLGKPISSNWVVLKTTSPTLSHSTSLFFHPTSASTNSSPTSSLRESDGGSPISLKNSVRKKLSALSVRKASDESRSNTATSYTRKTSTNHIRRNILSGRQKDPSASSNRDSGDSLEQEYFSSSSSSTSSLEIEFLTRVTTPGCEQKGRHQSVETLLPSRIFLAL